MYTYFKNKEDLLRLLLFETLLDMFDLSLSILSNSPQDKEFEAMIRANFKWVKDNCEFSKIYFGVILQPSIMIMFQEELFKCMQPLFLSISEFFSNKGYKNPKLETRYFISTLDGIFMNYIMDADNFPISEIEEKIISQYITRQL